MGWGMNLLPRPDLNTLVLNLFWCKNEITYVPEESTDTSYERLPRRTDISDCAGDFLRSRGADRCKRGNPERKNDSGKTKRSQKGYPPTNMFRLCTQIFEMRLKIHGDDNTPLLYHSFSSTTTSASLPSRSFFFRVSFGSGFGLSPASFRNAFKAPPAGGFPPMSP